MKYHTQSISAPAPGQSDPAFAAEGPGQVGSASDPRQHATTSGEAAATGTGSLDFSEIIVVQNPFGGGEVRVDSMDFTPGAEGAPSERDAGGANLLDNLTMGMWVELREAGDHAPRRPVKLIFVSPRKTRYLFALDRVGKEIIECSRAEIGRRFRVGEARIVDEPPEESLFDRIMNGLVGKLRAPGAPN